MAAEFEALAVAYADRDDVIIAEMDGTQNTLELFQTSPYPTLTLFLKDTNEVRPYTGIRKKRAFQRFLRRAMNKVEEEPVDILNFLKEHDEL